MHLKLYISSPQMAAFDFEATINLEEHISKEDFSRMTENKKREFLYYVALDKIFEEYLEFNYELEDS